MKPEIVLEKNPEDINWAELLALIHRAFAFMEGRIDPPSSLHRLDADGLQRKAQIENLIIAKMDGVVVGCLFAREEGALLYVGKVAVEPSLQKAGIGRRLIDSAIRLASELGMFSLELETRVELTENRAYFESFGFRKVGESAHEGYDRPTSIRLRLELDD